MTRGRYRILAAGVSTGGVEALQVLLGALPATFPLPVLIAHHVSPEFPSDLAGLLERRSAMPVKEADADEFALGGNVYLAPPNYHLLVEKDGLLALSVDPPVNFARPSVDVLFEATARAFGAEAIGLVLTGAGADGSEGLRTIKAHGGLAIVQDPEDAIMDGMPRNALAAVTADHVVPLGEVAPLLCRLTGITQPKREGEI